MALSSLKEKLYCSSYADCYGGFIDACCGGVQGIDNLQSQLKAKGEAITKADIIMPAPRNGTPFVFWGKNDYSRVIQHIGKLLEVIHENGEAFSADELLEKRSGNNGSIVDYACKYKSLAQIFTPIIWANRVSEMEKLWDRISRDYRDQVDFPKLKSQAEALSGPEFEIQPSLRKEQLFAANDKGMTPLDDSRTWKKLEQIFTTLGANGDQLTKADFLRKNRGGKTYLEAAVNAGQQDRVFDLLERQGDKITAQDVKEHNLGSLFMANNQEFWNAAVTNEMNKVRATLKLGLVDLEYKRTTEDGTALWACAHRGHADMVELLASAGADADIKIGKYNAIHIAAYKGGVKAVEKVVAALEKQFADNPSALFDALTRKDGDNETPIQETKHNNHRDAVPIIEAAISRAQLKMINQDNPDVTKVFSDGNTFLNVAVRAGAWPLVERTVAKLQDVHSGQPQKLYEALTKQGTDEQTPESAARKGGKTDVADLIKEATTKAIVTRGNIEDVYKAAERGDAELIKRFTEAKTVDFNTGYGDRKWPPIIIAAYKGQEAAFDALIEGGANPDGRAAERYHASALTMSGYQGTTALAQKVVSQLKQKYGNDPIALFKALTFKDADGYSPYMAAKRKGNNSTAEVIHAAVAELIPQVLDWDAKTLKETEAYRVLGEHEKLGELFKAERWKGKLAELQETWKDVPRDYAGQVKYDDVFSAAYLLTYPIEEITSKAQLLPREGQTQSALEFKPTWEHIDQVVEQLERGGERLTKEDLLKKASDGKTLLHKGIEFGQANKIFDMLAISEELLGKAELLDRNGGADKSNLDLLAEQGKLALVFTPDNWGNNVREMQECWSRVHNSHKQQLDGKEGRPSYKRIQQEANALSVKSLQLGIRAVGE